jgi:hypothetical protein
MEEVRVWYDSEGDSLEVMFKQQEGYFRETGFDQVLPLYFKVSSNFIHDIAQSTDSESFVLGGW